MPDLLRNHDGGLLRPPFAPKKNIGPFQFYPRGVLLGTPVTAGMLRYAFSSTTGYWDPRHPKCPHVGIPFRRIVQGIGFSERRYQGQLVRNNTQHGRSDRVCARRRRRVLERCGAARVVQSWLAFGSRQRDRGDVPAPACSHPPSPRPPRITSPAAQNASARVVIGIGCALLLPAAASLHAREPDGSSAGMWC